MNLDLGSMIKTTRIKLLITMVILSAATAGSVGIYLYQKRSVNINNEMNTASDNSVPKFDVQYDPEVGADLKDLTQNVFRLGEEVNAMKQTINWDIESELDLRLESSSF